MRTPCAAFFEREPEVLIFENPERVSSRRRRTLRIDRTAELCISDDICGTHNSIPPAGLYLDEVADQ